VPKWPCKASVSCGIFGRSLPLTSPASARGLRSPAISASIIARPDWVSTLEATEVSLIPASWSTFSSRAISLARMSACVLR
jgi:hypothetical protein